MKRHLALALLLILLALPFFRALPALADPGHGDEQQLATATDDPTIEPTAADPDSPVPGEQEARRPAAQSARRVSLVGALQLTPPNQGVHADVAAYKKLAFIGKWAGPCPGTGVDIIDIANPAAPVKIAHTEEHANTSLEDMAAMQIGQRDVLAIGLQNCGNAGPAGKTGLELVDISDPRQPQTLSFFASGSRGVHELNLTRTPSGRTLALLAVPTLEAITADANGRDGRGDLLIVDISDPTQPTLAGEWGVLDEPALGRDFSVRVRQGSFPATFLHSVRANEEGTLAYLSYWDAGVIILDISAPARPVLLGRTTFAPGDEGDAHSIALARGGDVLVQADEDFSPFHLDFAATAPSALAGSQPATEASFTPRLRDLPTRVMSGDVVHVGRGCPPGTPGLADGDPYLADPTGKIALIERGLCRFDNKVAWAQKNGAVGAIVYNNAAEGEALLAMSGDRVVSGGAPAVVGTAVAIPAVLVGNRTGLAIGGALGDGQTVSVKAQAAFDGWGFLRFFDVRDPRRPVPLGTFATANAGDENVAAQGTFSVHNAEVHANRVYASWYSDGLRVVDLSDPAAPREVGFWAGAGAPAGAPAVFIWGVVVHDGLVLLSDVNFGLYIVKVDG